MSRKLMLVFIAAIICILCAGAVSAADINETSMDIQTSQSDVLDDVSDTNLSNTYYENNDLSEEDSSDVAENTTFSAENTNVLKTDYFKVTLTDSSANPLANQTVIFNVLNKNYTRTTDSSGMAYLQMNLDAGNYTVSMFYSGDLNYAPTNKSFDINIYQISTKLSVKSVKILRGNYYVVTLTDTSGNVLANRTVTFTVNGRTYTRNTRSLGTASLRLTLKAGTYSIKTISPAADGYAASSITKSVKIYQKASSLTVSSKKVYKGNYLTVYLKDSSGAMAKRTVVLIINGKTYSKTTNSKGAVKLKMSMTPKTYTLKLKYAGDISHKSASKSIKITVKKSTFTSQLVVSGSTKSVNGLTYTYSKSNKNTVVVKNGGKLTFTNGKIVKTGDVSSSYSESSDFYGTNAAVLVTAKSTLAISDTTITTNL